jgi:hypothetical protein
MGHPPFVKGATRLEQETVNRLYHVASIHREPEVRSALSAAVELIVELIEERGKRREVDDVWDRPHDGG